MIYIKRTSLKIKLCPLTIEFINSKYFMTMKKNLIWKVAAFIYALCMLNACNSDNDDGNAPREGLKLIDHHIDIYGFQEVIENYRGSSINIICNLCEFYGNPAQSDIKEIEYLCEIKQGGGDGYASIYVSCWAFYNSTVERDFCVEYKDGYKRLIQKNIKLTIKYIGCTSCTPTEKIPTDTETKVITYPDIVGDWVVDEPGDDDELLHSDNNGGGSDNDSNDDETGYEITPVNAFYIFSPSYSDPSSGYTTLYLWTNKSTGEKILSSSDYKINRRGNIRNNTDTNYLGFYVGDYRYTALYVRSVGEMYVYYFN